MFVWCLAPSDENVEKDLGPQDDDDEPLSEKVNLLPADPALAGWYRIKIRRVKSPLGLDLEGFQIGLMVKSVHKGVVKIHNVCSSNRSYVYSMDFITRVNGLTNVEDMIEELKKPKRLVLDLAHPEYMDAQIQLKGSRLGVELRTSKTVINMFEILRISSGALKTYNAKRKPQDRIMVGDFITSINGVSGNTDLMYAQLESDIVDLKLFRIAQPPPEELQRSPSMSTVGTAVSTDSHHSQASTPDPEHSEKKGKSKLSSPIAASFFSPSKLFSPRTSAK